jgi:hypothetical protein
VKDAKLRILRAKPNFVDPRADDAAQIVQQQLDSQANWLESVGRGGPAGNASAGVRPMSATVKVLGPTPRGRAFPADKAPADA